MTGRAEWDLLAERLRAARSGRDAVVAAVDGLSPVGGVYVLSRALGLDLGEAKALYLETREPGRRAALLEFEDRFFSAFASRMQGDLGRGPGWEVAGPTPEQAEDAIRRLDGAARTEVRVGTDVRHLSVAGGPDLFLVTGRDADGTLLHLHDTGAGADEVRLVCGGQLGIFRRDALVPLDAALAAMTDHLAGRTGGHGPEWERTPDS